MYIGPWQEFKLARLIQQQQQQGDTPLAAAASKPQPRRRPGVPRRFASDADGDDIASVASSSRSGFSTQSAPAHLQGQASAQNRLNDYYDSVERSSRRGNSLDSQRPAPRPGSAVGARSASLRSLQQPRAGVGGGGATAKRKPVKPKPPNPEKARRERILAMQKLYGLARDEGEEESATASTPSSMLSSFAEVSSAPPPAGPLLAGAAERQVTPDVDRALYALQASISASEAMPVAQAATGVPMSGERDATAWPLTSLPEDPLNQSTVSLLSMASSGGLIAWSKALQKEEEVSPPATLASFFKM